MNDKTRQILNLTGELLSSPSRRCSGTSAEDEDGKPAFPWEEKACKWCLTGAITHIVTHNVNYVEEPYLEVDVLAAIRDTFGIAENMPIPAFWDNLETEFQQKVADILKVAI